MDKLRCRYCVKEFKYESEKRRHELSHSPRFLCEICDKKFSFISALRRHEKQHQRTGNVQCNQCSRKFRDESLLDRHIKYAHKGKYTCNKCNKEFHSELALSTHEKIHNAKSERKYQCSYSGCGKTFNFPHHLKHHESTHTNVRQYYCIKCKKGFIQYHHLKSHMKRHDPEKWLLCPERDCEKKFPTEYSRKRHLLLVHNKKLDDTSPSDSSPERVDTLLCTACGEVVDVLLYKDHQSKCLAFIDYTQNFYKEKGEEPKNELSQINYINNNSPYINDCKSALGTCIMNGNPNEKCLCAQIVTTVDEYNEDLLIPNENINSTNIPVLSPAAEPEKTKNDYGRGGCENCECGSSYFERNNASANVAKENTQKRNCGTQNNGNNNVPVVEYKTDGIIKLKDTFDSDIAVFENAAVKKDEMLKHDAISNYVLYNSCKAVLGKCIVSGNGTMNEECLCAKMLVEEQQVTPEEIDEITPRPARNYTYSSVINLL